MAQLPVFAFNKKTIAIVSLVLGLLGWSALHISKKGPDAVATISSLASKRESLLTFYRTQKCNTADVIEGKAKGTQMTDAQIFFIVDSLHAAQYINNAESKLLVFGLGNDSPTWRDLNCNRRTVFIEDNSDWYNMITSKYAGIEAYLYKYNTTLGDAQRFYDQPFMMEIHPNVDTECFDLILIDAPMGFDSSKPGRMAPAHYTQNRVKECMAQKKKNIMFVFMHDMERPGEQEIVRHYFLESDGWIPLGAIVDPGRKAKLNGWAFVR